MTYRTNFLGVEPVYIDPGAHRHQHRRRDQILLPDLHKNASIHFIFQTDILSVVNPVAVATASTTAKRTFGLSAPWQRITAPK